MTAYKKKGKVEVPAPVEGIYKNHSILFLGLVKSNIRVHAKN